MTHPKWISINKQLPSNEGDYLIFGELSWGVSPNNKKMLHIYLTIDDINNFRINLNQGQKATYTLSDSIFAGMQDIKITHWMLAPRKPDENYSI